MRIPLDRQSPEPLYQQIKAHLRQGILSGGLEADTRLPASRQLAHDLGVNRITVENAYSELEADGLIFSRVGSGTYVLPPNPLPLGPRTGSETSWPLWQQNMQARHTVSRPGAMEAMLKAGGHAHPISFASGISDTRQFPAEEFRKTAPGCHATGWDRGDGLRRAAADMRHLREGIAHILASQGLQTRPENILITAGSQQAIVAGGSGDPEAGGCHPGGKPHLFQRDRVIPCAWVSGSSAFRWTTRACK